MTLFKNVIKNLYCSYVAHSVESPFPLYEIIMYIFKLSIIVNIKYAYRFDIVYINSGWY